MTVSKRWAPASTPDLGRVRSQRKESLKKGRVDLGLLEDGMSKAAYQAENRGMRAVFLSLLRDARSLIEAFALSMNLHLCHVANADPLAT